MGDTEKSKRSSFSGFTQAQKRDYARGKAREQYVVMRERQREQFPGSTLVIVSMSAAYVLECAAEDMPDGAFYGHVFVEPNVSGSPMTPDERAEATRLCTQIPYSESRVADELFELEDAIVSYQRTGEQDCGWQPVELTVAFGVSIAEGDSPDAAFDAQRFLWVHSRKNRAWPGWDSDGLKWVGVPVYAVDTERKGRTTRTLLTTHAEAYDAAGRIKTTRRIISQEARDRLLKRGPGAVGR